ncbi:MAG: DUF4926 domain-containing protein [Candidatus Rokubacteria bacterium]|nr:DUF4926 domain-containing protein [Candidatus Rokubacteria bacterium]
MIREHDRVVLTTDLANEGLKAGDVGTVVHIHSQGEAFEVEFLTLDGRTVAIATVLNSQLRAVIHRDITHARPLEISV